MTTGETLRARQAALLLHGLPQDARGRVLARLSAGEVARLQPLLEELGALGFSPSICQKLQATPPASVPAAMRSGASARERARSLNGPDVARALQSCAPFTIAAVLRISDWPWKQEVLDLCSELRRAEVRQHLRGDAPAVAPAVADALCERLCEEIQSWTR